MRVLIIEDSEERIKKFREHFIGNTVVFTKDVSEAKNLIDKAGWNLICLDHDLNDEDLMTSKVEGTGHEVARYMIENMNEDDKKQLTVIIHSYNIGKAKVMEEELQQSGFTVHQIPFDSFFKLVKV